MTTREIKKDELWQLLRLYTDLHDNVIPENSGRLLDLWENIYRDDNYHIIVTSNDNVIVSSCVLIIIPNLTHNQRPYALIENVVTDVHFRNSGYASDCLDFAKKVSESYNCYKIMLMTGSKDEKVLDFYRKAGYNSDDKTAFIQWLEGKDDTK